LRDGLSDLASAFGGTPLGPAVSEGVERLLRAEFSTSAFIALAAVRTALMGSLHDALWEQALAACDLVSEDRQGAEEAVILPPAGDAALLSGLQQWLGEVAVAGTANLDEAQLAPFETVLGQLQAREERSGLAALLTGFVEELTQAAQRSSRQDAPSHRWADLWCAAMLGAQVQTQASKFKKVAGVFHPCGIDVSEHRAFVSATVWGLFAVDGERPRAARIPFSSWKVSVATGDEIWKLFLPAAQRFLDALASGEAMRIEGELGVDGDLRVVGESELCGPTNPFTLPIPWTAIPAAPAAVRHPVHMMQMIRIDEGKISSGENGPELSAGKVALPLDARALERTGFEMGMLEAATGVIALLRWDAGRWRVQPICLHGKGKLKNGLRAGH
jgi:hypothetical protein